MTIKNVGPDKKWFIFSHAGIIPTTVKGIRFKQQGNIDKDINDWNAILDSGNGLSLNEVFHLKSIKKLEELFIKVGFISTYRRGPYEFGSIIESIKESDFFIATAISPQYLLFFTAAANSSAISLFGILTFLVASL